MGQDLRISKKSIDVMNSFMFDMYERIGDKAFQLVKNKKRSTVGEAQIEAAAKLVLGQEIFKDCEDKYKKAIARYRKAIESE